MLPNSRWCGRSRHRRVIKCRGAGPPRTKTLDGVKKSVTIRLYIFLALAVGFAVGFALGRFRVSAFQNRGEARLSRSVQLRFGPPDYHLMNHVTLQLKDGTTQIDHVLVSRFGVFVIETKDYKGWIFANACSKS